MRARAPSFRLADRGTTSVEFGLIVSVFMLVLLGIAEFALAYWQWNAAAKAAHLGARLAAVSDPVDKSLKDRTGLEDGAQPGDPMPDYEVACSGAEKSCTGGEYYHPAMEALVYGPGNGSACPQGPQPYPPMCQVFARVTPANVVITYSHTGLGFAGRPGGPVPTITLRLEGIAYDFIVLNHLIGNGTFMPSFTTTVTGESLSSIAP